MRRGPRSSAARVGRLDRVLEDVGSTGPEPRPKRLVLFLRARLRRRADDVRRSSRARSSRVRGGRAAAGEGAAGVRGEAGAGIGEVYAALDAVLKGWVDKSAARYKPAADPFSFDLQPRADLTAFYVEPAQTRPAVGYLGSAGLDVATVTIWASREARDDAGAAGLALANDLQRLRRAVCDADLGDDVLLRPTFESAVSTRREGAAGPPARDRTRPLPPVFPFVRHGFPTGLLGSRFYFGKRHVP